MRIHLVQVVGRSKEGWKELQGGVAGRIATPAAKIGNPVALEAFPGPQARGIERIGAQGIAAEGYGDVGSRGGVAGEIEAEPLPCRLPPPHHDTVVCVFVI